MYLIGLDIGTTGCKSSIFTTDGRYLSSVSREYQVDIPHPKWAEQDGENVWRLAQETLAEVYQNAGGAGEVISIGISCQGEAIVPVDRNWNAIRPFILGMDTRTDPENNWLRENMGAMELFMRTGMPIHTINTLPKLLWLKKYEPDTWKNAYKFLFYEDFLIAKMTGASAVSRCLASRSQMVDLHQGAWSSVILNEIGLEINRLSDVHDSGFPAGTMKASLAKKLGFPNSPVISTGGHDQACGSLGVGLTRAGLSMDSTGTAEVIEVVLDHPATTEALEKTGISIYSHVVPGLFLAMTLNHSGGMSLRWFRDTFCQEEIRLAKEKRVDPYDLIFQDVTSDPSPLFLLPHFSGSGTPHFDTQSKGAFVGMTFSSRKVDFAKAVVEGVTYELRYNLETLRECGIQIDELRAIGGGAKSKYWLQLKADITGTRVLAPRVTEAASWGAAVLGGVAAGVYKDPCDVVQKSMEISGIYVPVAENQAKQEPRYQLYRELYPALALILHRI